MVLAKSAEIAGQLTKEVNHFPTSFDAVSKSKKVIINDTHESFGKYKPEGCMKENNIIFIFENHCC
jgi:hypothetical protein